MAGFGQFCPVAKSTEVLGQPWTLLIIRELCCNDQSFSNLRMGVPLMSPSLLSTRLKLLERNRVITRTKTDSGVLYSLTEAGQELQPVIMALGIWGQRWVRSDMSNKDLDPTLLMWDIHRHIDTSYFPKSRTVIHFQFVDYTVTMRFWWLLIDKDSVDICFKDPGHEPDLYINTELKTMTQIWMGDLPVSQAIKAKKIQLTGDSQLIKTFKAWIGRGDFSPHSAAPDSLHQGSIPPQRHH
ncbi:MAG: helix-turn-helix domain-containing protein [Motiliproteus sp.]